MFIQLENKASMRFNMNMSRDWPPCLDICNEAPLLYNNVPPAPFFVPAIYTLGDSVPF